jgi:hypothetical protein
MLHLQLQRWRRRRLECFTKQKRTILPKIRTRLLVIFAGIVTRIGVLVPEFSK